VRGAGVGTVPLIRRYHAAEFVTRDAASYDDSVVRWGSALGSEPRTSGPRDAPTHFRIHTSTACLFHLSLASPPPPPCAITFVTSRSSLFPQIEQSRPTRLVGRFVSSASPAQTSPIGLASPSKPSFVGFGSGIASPDRRTILFTERFPPPSPRSYFLYSF
jgi:hypothetical protein